MYQGTSSLIANTHIEPKVTNLLDDFKKRSNTALSFARNQLTTAENTEATVGEDDESSLDDEFYTTDIVHVGSPKKWFAKTSGTRVYIKDLGNSERREIEQNLKKIAAKNEVRRDKFIRREILRKNIWKYKG